MNSENKGQLLLYQTLDGQAKIEVKLYEETVWLTLDQMAELFQRNKSTISRHIKNIFDSKELSADSTVAFFATVQTEGQRKVERSISFYNLDMIISVGYRVNSMRGVQFRMWATRVLKEYLIKGFAMNDDFLKLSEKQLLNHAGTVSAEIAEQKQMRSMTGSKRELRISYPLWRYISWRASIGSRNVY